MKAALFRFLHWWCVLDSHERIVRIVSLMPFIDDHGGTQGCVAWPQLLVDSFGGNRKTITPIWERNRYKDFFTRKHYGYHPAPKSKNGPIYSWADQRTDTFTRF